MKSYSCWTEIKIEADAADIGKLEKEFKTAVSGYLPEDEQELQERFGSEWVGNLLRHIGVADKDIGYKQGSVCDICRNKPNVIEITIEALEDPIVKSVKKFVDAFTDRAVITYTAKCPYGEIYWTNDTDKVNTVCIDDDADLPQELSDFLCELEGMGKEDARDTLAGYLGHPGTFNGLIRSLYRYFDTEDLIHLYEYHDIEETY